MREQYAGIIRECRRVPAQLIGLMPYVSRSDIPLEGMYPFLEYGTIVDVGGGDGTFLANIMAEHPNVRVVLLGSEAATTATATSPPAGHSQPSTAPSNAPSPEKSSEPSKATAISPTTPTYDQPAKPRTSPSPTPPKPATPGQPASPTSNPANAETTLSPTATAHGPPPLDAT